MECIELWTGFIVLACVEIIILSKIYSHFQVFQWHHSSSDLSLRTVSTVLCSYSATPSFHCIYPWNNSAHHSSRWFSLHNSASVSSSCWTLSPIYLGALQFIFIILRSCRGLTRACRLALSGIIFTRRIFLRIEKGAGFCCRALLVLGFDLLLSRLVILTISWGLSPLLPAPVFPLSSHLTHH